MDDLTQESFSNQLLRPEALHATNPALERAVEERDRLDRAIAQLAAELEENRSLLPHWETEANVEKEAVRRVELLGKLALVGGHYYDSSDAGIEGLEECEISLRDSSQNHRFWDEPELDDYGYDEWLNGRHEFEEPTEAIVIAVEQQDWRTMIESVHTAVLLAGVRNGQLYRGVLKDDTHGGIEILPPDSETDITPSDEQLSLIVDNLTLGSTDWSHVLRCQENLAEYNDFTARLSRGEETPEDERWRLKETTEDVIRWETEIAEIRQKISEQRDETLGLVFENKIVTVTGTLVEEGTPRESATDPDNMTGTIQATQLRIVSAVDAGEVSAEHPFGNMLLLTGFDRDGTSHTVATRKTQYQVAA